MTPASRHRLYAALLSLGAAFLLSRTIMLTVQGYLTILVPWLAATVVLEGALDLATLIFCLRWLKTGSPTHASTPLRLTAAVVFFHAPRVLAFALGRTATFWNFDVRPEHRALHDTHWTWTGVYIASIMSILSIIVVVVIWYYRRKSRNRR